MADNFYSAALGAETWYSALSKFAAATGSRTGQLITIGPNAGVPMHLLTNADPGLDKAFAEGGEGDPAVNPRVRAGMSAPLLKVLAENDFISPEDHKTHRHYQEFARPWDVPFICLTTLDRQEGLVVGLAVCRTQREGHISPQERTVFANLAPHVRAAVRMQMLLAEQSTVLLQGVFESLALPAFLCDRLGRVSLLTATAEGLVADGSALRMKNGKLVAAIDADNRALLHAIEVVAQASSFAARTPQTVTIRSAHANGSALSLDIIRMPARALEFHSKSQVLVVPAGTNGTEARRRVLLQTVYELTTAEADVALLLAQGFAAEMVATRRGVAVATVRSQIKSIFLKLEVTRQIELVAQLSRL